MGSHRTADPRTDPAHSRARAPAAVTGPVPRRVARRPMAPPFLTADTARAWAPGRAWAAPREAAQARAAALVWATARQGRGSGCRTGAGSRPPRIGITARPWRLPPVVTTLPAGHRRPRISTAMIGAGRARRRVGRPAPTVPGTARFTALAAPFPARRCRAAQRHRAQAQARTACPRTPGARAQQRLGLRACRMSRAGRASASIHTLGHGRNKVGRELTPDRAQMAGPGRMLGHG